MNTELDRKRLRVYTLHNSKKQKQLIKLMLLLLFPSVRK